MWGLTSMWGVTPVGGVNPVLGVTPVEESLLWHWGGHSRGMRGVTPVGGITQMGGSHFRGMGEIAHTVVVTSVAWAGNHSHGGITPMGVVLCVR